MDSPKDRYDFTDSKGWSFQIDETSFRWKRPGGTWHTTPTANVVTAAELLRLKTERDRLEEENRLLRERAVLAEMEREE